MSTNVLILHNPRSGSRHAVDVVQNIVAHLQERGLVGIALDSLDSFQQRAEELISKNDLRAVISAGGDGTATAVVQRVHRDTPIWICPLGTENLLAKHLGMSIDPEQTAASIKAMKTRRFDAGLANGKLFLILTGVGYDAEVVRQVHTNRRGHIRRWHYWWPILKCAFTYPFPKLRLSVIESDAYSNTSAPHNSWEACWFFLINQPRYADGLAIAPAATGDDGLIDACSFKCGGILRSLRYLLAIRSGTHAKLADFRTEKLSKFRIEVIGSDQKNPAVPLVSYQIDGDWGGYLPLEIESLPGRLCTIMPA